MSETINESFTLPEERVNGWYFKAIFGPFETKEEADKYYELLRDAVSVNLVHDTPPPLGINVSETINAADKFG